MLFIHITSVYFLNDDQNFENLKKKSFHSVFLWLLVVYCQIIQNRTVMLGSRSL